MGFLDSIKGMFSKKSDAQPAQTIQPTTDGMPNIADTVPVSTPAPEESKNVVQQTASSVVSTAAGVVDTVTPPENVDARVAGEVHDYSDENPTQTPATPVQAPEAPVAPEETSPQTPPTQTPPQAQVALRLKEAFTSVIVPIRNRG